MSKEKEFVQNFALELTNRNLEEREEIGRKYYQQLQSKEQECERLDNEAQNLFTEKTNLETELDQLKSENEELKKANIHIDNNRMVKADKLKRIEDLIIACSSGYTDEFIQELLVILHEPEPIKE